MIIIEKLRKILTKNTLKHVTPKNLVFITGCDSGLGFNLALLCHSLNMTVISGCLNINSDGAKILKNISSIQDKKESLHLSKILPIELDLLKPKTISEALNFTENLINRDEYIFTALINNAGIMCFGEFEWQTNRIFELQIQINLLGTMKITKKFLPLIRMHKGRIINVTSHCGLYSLPGLGPYAASKAALRFWNDSLRIELNKYGIDVVNFIPGSFVTLSNIAAEQQNYANEMRNEFSKEQTQFYGKYFENYNNYLKFISEYKNPIKIDDQKLMDKFKYALLHKSPNAIYKHEPWRYTIYHWLFKICPISIADWLTKKFVAMPAFECKNLNN